MTPTDEIASASERACPRVLVGFQHASWMRLFVYAIAVVIMASWTTFVVIRLNASYALELAVDRLGMEVAALTTARSDEYLALEDRVQSLERTVFGELSPKSKMSIVVPKTPAELWQRNRDEELRKTLISIQRQLLVVDTRLRELEKP